MTFVIWLAAAFLGGLFIREVLLFLLCRIPDDPDPEPDNPHANLPETVRNPNDKYFTHG